MAIYRLSIILFSILSPTPTDSAQYVYRNPLIYYMCQTNWYISLTDQSGRFSLYCKSSVHSLLNSMPMLVLDVVKSLPTVHTILYHLRKKQQTFAQSAWQICSVQSAQTNTTTTTVQSAHGKSSGTMDGVLTRTRARAVQLTDREKRCKKLMFQGKL